MKKAPKKQAKVVEKKMDRRILLIADKIKSMRKAKGYKNYDKFAWDNDISRISYWRMEHGVNFRIDSLLKILDLHKVSMEDFFKGLK